jgi:glutathione reductase (NADPH)
MHYDYDLIVIGAGSGGVRTARMSSSKGLKVAIIESRELGGTCVNVGCIPKKLFVYASEYGQKFEESKGFGWNIENSKFEWQTLVENKNEEIKRLNGIYRNLLENSGAKIIKGVGLVTGPHSVEVEKKIYTAKNILVATGGKPYTPDFPGNNFIVSSDEAFFLKSLPKKILIVGGGYIAIEFAGIFNGLGVETHLMYRGPLFLKGFDIDIRKKIKEEYIKHGVKIHFSKEVNSIKQNPPVDSSDKSNKFAYEISTKTGDSIQSDLVMFATGRKPNLDTLGLDKLKLEKNQDGTLIVDEFYRTSVKSIFAIGDVVGKKQLTPVAIAEGNVLTKYLTEGKKPFVNYKNIPTAIFSTPNSASVGYTEDEAIIEFNKDLQIYKSQFKPMKQTLGGSQTKIFMKLIVVKSTNKVVGCHMVGDYAGEIIQGLAIAIQAGATKKDFDNTIGIHPTAAEEFVTLK